MVSSLSVGLYVRRRESSRDQEIDLGTSRVGPRPGRRELRGRCDAQLLAGFGCQGLLWSQAKHGDCSVEEEVGESNEVQPGHELRQSSIVLDH
jgi:hypothetical protein